MSENNTNNVPEMEDISSTSVEFRAKKNPVMAYSSGLYKNLGNTCVSLQTHYLSEMLFPPKAVDARTVRFLKTTTVLKTQ